MSGTLDPVSLAQALAPIVLRDAPAATFHGDTGDDGYWCISWRLNHRAKRELFVELPGVRIAPNLLRVGIYFQDALVVSALNGRSGAMDAVDSRRDVLAALGVAPTFTYGDTTRDDRIFTLAASDLVVWLGESCPHRDLVRRHDLQAAEPTISQLSSQFEALTPIWQTWNALE
jgi:hypothetical protein